MVVELALELLLAYSEWQDGVLSADSPAERAMCIKGRLGREKSSWWVLTKRLDRNSQRDSEYIPYVLSAAEALGCNGKAARTLYGSTLVPGECANNPAARCISGLLVVVFKDMYFCAWSRASSN